MTGDRYPMNDSEFSYDAGCEDCEVPERRKRRSLALVFEPDPISLPLFSG